MTTNFIDIETINAKAFADVQPQTVALELDESLPLKRRDFLFPHISKVNIQGNLRVDILPSISDYTAVVVVAPDKSIDTIQIIEAESELFISLRQDIPASDKGIVGRVVIFQNDTAKITISQFTKCFVAGISPTTQLKITARDNSFMNIENVVTNTVDSEVTAQTGSNVIATNMKANRICYWAKADSRIEVHGLSAYDTVLNVDRDGYVSADGYSGKVTSNAEGGGKVAAANLTDIQEVDTASNNSVVEGSNPLPHSSTYGSGVVTNAPIIKKEDEILVARVEDVERIEQVVIPRV
ncbi:MAG: hypothetical protein NC311_09275 [Muribaculaceae bacterium]|nr:hypothetical protein [Muribaculaceae bacterium]